MLMLLLLVAAASFVLHLPNPLAGRSHLPSSLLRIGPVAAMSFRMFDMRQVD